MKLSLENVLCEKLRIAHGKPQSEWIKLRNKFRPNQNTPEIHICCPGLLGALWTLTLYILMDFLPKPINPPGGRLMASEVGIWISPLWPVVKKCDTSLPNLQITPEKVHPRRERRKEGKKGRRGKEPLPKWPFQCSKIRFNDTGHGTKKAFLFVLCQNVNAEIQKKGKRNVKVNN